MVWFQRGQCGGGRRNRGKRIHHHYVGNGNRRIHLGIDRKNLPRQSERPRLLHRAVAGLVVITPACGYVSSTGAVIIGVLAAVVPYIAVSIVKPALDYDDALDTFGVHAVGGTLGALLTGLLATSKANSNLTDKLLSTLFVSQVEAVIVTIILSVVGSAIIALVLRTLLGLRTDPEIETSGLDIAEHGEEAYID
jgi:Amt family ammonium transporter